MEEEKKDVEETVESSTTEEPVTPEVVKEPETTTPQETPKETEEVVEPVEVKDDRPLENLFWEQKRKVDDLNEKFSTLIDRLPEGGQAQPQKPQWSKAQLRAFAETQPENKVWAYEEMDKIDKAERHAEMESMVSKYKTQSDSGMRKQQAYNWVQANPVFDKCFTKDAQGKTMGWNPSSPLTRKIGEYMNQPRFANDPEGIAGAAKMAAFDLGITINPQQQNKLNRTVGQLRKEQKKQLASAGGSHSAETPETASKVRMGKLQAEYQKTGSRDVFAEIVKLKGLNPFI